MSDYASSAGADTPDPEYKQYKRKGLSEMRRYVPGESLKGVSVSKEDTPEEGGMIARNPKNHDDKWYVAKKYFEENLEEAGAEPPTPPASGDIDIPALLSDLADYLNKSEEKIVISKTHQSAPIEQAIERFIAERKL